MPLTRTLAFTAALASAAALALVPTAAATATAVRPAATTAIAAPTVPNTRPAWEGLALTPPMGYNDWAYFTYNFTAASLLAQAQAMKVTGLVAAGYDTLTVDDSWMTKDRDLHGNLVVDTAKFPDGMKAFGDKLHALGMKFGIYADAGTATCGGYAGSLGHEAQDARQFASWGVDYVKVDGCNLSGQAQYVSAYKAWSTALEKQNSGRSMVFSASLPAYFQHGDATTWHNMIELSGDIGNLWREGDDVRYANSGHDALWASIMNNYNYNVGLAQYAGPGHWNDPDFLIIGANGLTHDEEVSQMSLYSEMASPLNMSTDVTELSPQQLAVLSNKEVIAVDQDPLGAQGYLAQQDSTSDVLVKPLQNGDHAVVLFNKSSAPAQITTSLSALGISGTVSIRDLWQHRDLGQTSDAISAMVPAHGVAMYRLAAVPTPKTAAVQISATGGVVAGATGGMTLKATNAGSGDATNVTVRLAAPSGVSVTSGTQLTIPTLAAGASVSIPVGLSAAASVPTGNASLTATESSPGTAESSWPIAVQVNAPAPSGTVYLGDAPWVAQTNISDGPYQRNLQYDGKQKIVLDGTTYDKGIGGQPAGSVTVDLGGRCSTFSATIGIDDYNLDYAIAHGQPNVWSTFTLTDQNGTVLKNVDFTGGASGAPGTSPVQTLTADVSGVQQLTLANNAFGSNNYYAHADWADAKVRCAPDGTALPPTVTAQPASQSVAAGATVNLTATAAGNPAPTWQWQVSRDGGNSWSALADVPTAGGSGNSSTATLSQAVVASESGVMFRAVFQSAGGVIASDPAIVTVSGGGGAAAKTTLANAISDGVTAVAPGQSLAYTTTVTVGDEPASGVALTLASDSKAPFVGTPSVSVQSSGGSPLPFAAHVTSAASSIRVMIPGILPAGAIMTVVQNATVVRGLTDGSGTVTATAASTAGNLSATPGTASDKDQVSFKAALDNVFTDNTRDVYPGGTTTYVSTTTVGSSGFANKNAIAGPAEGVSLTITPDAALPFSGKPAVRVTDADGYPVTVPNTISGSGTHDSPYVVTFTGDVPQGTITTATPAAVPSSAAYATTYTATFASNLRNNGRTSAPATASDTDMVDNAPTVSNSLTANATSVRPGESYSFVATTTVNGGAARGFTMNLYGTLAAPLNDNPTVTVTAAGGSNVPVTSHVARSETSYTVSIDQVIPAGAVVTVAGNATVVAQPQATAPVGVRQTASALNLGGDPTHIDPKSVSLNLIAPIEPSVPLPAGCAQDTAKIAGVAADSQNTVSENTPATNAIDGNINTFWSSVWATGTTPYPHAITIDLGSAKTLCGLNYVPRQGNSNGRIAGYKVFVSDTPVTYPFTSEAQLGTLAASGTMQDSNAVQTALFDTPMTGRYVTLEGLGEVPSVHTGTMTAAELTVDTMLPAKATLTNELSAPAQAAAGSKIAYSGTVTVGSAGFANPSEVSAGPATGVTITLTPGATSPLTTAPTVSVKDADGKALAAASTVSGAGTNASPSVIAFTDPLPLGAVVTVTAEAMLDAAAGARVDAVLSSNLVNNGAATLPEQASASTLVGAATKPQPPAVGPATLTPATPTAGAQFTAVWADTVPGTAYRIILDGTTVLGTGTSASDGGLLFTTVLPANTTPGTHTLVLRDGDSDVSSTPMTVLAKPVFVAPGATSRTATTAGLAITGSNVVAGLALVALLLAAGAGMLLVRRRRAAR